MAKFYRTTSGYVVEDGGACRAVEGDLFAHWTATREVAPPTALLAPVVPSAAGGTTTVPRSPRTTLTSPLASTSSGTATTEVAGT